VESHSRAGGRGASLEIPTCIEGGRRAGRRRNPPSGGQKKNSNENIGSPRNSPRRNSGALEDTQKTRNEKIFCRKKTRSKNGRKKKKNDHRFLAANTTPLKPVRKGIEMEHNKRHPLTSSERQVLGNGGGFWPGYWTMPDLHKQKTHQGERKPGPATLGKGTGTGGVGTSRR